MTLRARILLPVALLGLVAVLISGASLWLQHRIGVAVDRVQTAGEAALALSEVRSVSRALQRDALNAIFEPEAGRRAILARFDRRVEAFVALVARVEAAPSVAGVAELEGFAALQGEVLAALRRVRDRAAAGDAAGAHALFIDEVRGREREASLVTDPFLDRQAEEIAALTAAADRLRTTAFHVVLWGSLAGIVGAVAAGSWIASRRVATPLAALTAVIERMARRDMSGEVPFRGNADEIGVIARAVGVFRDEMVRADALERAQADAAAREEARRRTTDGLVAGFVAEMDRIAGGLSAAGAGLRTDADRLADLARRTSEDAASTREAAQRVAENVQTVASATEELSASIREISSRLGEATGMTREAVAQAGEAVGRMQELSEAARQVGEIVGLISTIAGQTNLLALNATIESARAGEAGRGFAVVAGEVKELANQTARATEDVQERVAAIRAATDGAGAAIERITGTISRVSEITGTIAAAVEQQTAATSEISRTVSATSADTDTVRADIARLADGARTTDDVAEALLASATTVAGDASSLGNAVGGFEKALRSA